MNALAEELSIIHASVCADGTAQLNTLPSQQLRMNAEPKPLKLTNRLVIDAERGLEGFETGLPPRRGMSRQ